jgi:hypothetical protein
MMPVMMEDPGAWDPAGWQFDRFALAARPAATAPSGLTGHTGRTTSSGGVSEVRRSAGAAQCQVDACASDPTQMREYHLRYKICEAHLKALAVPAPGGGVQRFCQQCGKFQAAGEFDGEKRSCRERLDKHNARRRRHREMQHMLRTTGRVDEAAIAAKYGLGEGEVGPKAQKLAAQMSARNSLDSRSSDGFAGSPSGADSPFLPGLDGAGALPELSAADMDLLDDSFLDAMWGPGGLSPLDGAMALRASAPAGYGFGAGGGGLGWAPGGGSSAGAAPFLSVDPASVMDLDDMATLEELTREFGMDPNEAAMLAAAGGAAGAGAAPAASAGPAPVRASAPPLQLRPAGSAPGSGTSIGTGAPLQGGLAAARAAGAFPFLPPAAYAYGAGSVVTTGAAQAVPPYLQPPAMQAQQAQHFAALQAQQQAHFAAQQAQQQAALAAQQQAAAAAVGAPAAVRGSGNAAYVAGSAAYLAGAQAAAAAAMAAPAAPSAPAGSVLSEALGMLQFDHAALRYAADQRVLRASVKFFGATPADLPPTVRASLIAALAAEAAKGVDGSMRPGCVLLEVDALLGGAELAALRARGARGAAEALAPLLAGGAASAACGAKRAALLQLGDQVALLHGGEVARVVRLAGAAGPPALAAARPLAAAVGHAPPTLDFALWGYALGAGGGDEEVRARCAGAPLDATILSVAEDAAWGCPGLQRMDVRVRGPFTPGALRVEVVRGGAGSAARTVLLAGSPAAAAEARSLETLADEGEIDTLLFELGAVAEAAAAGGGADAAFWARAPAPPAAAARRLLPFLVQRGWPTLAAAALGAAALEGGAAGAIAGADAAALAAAGLPLLALAVRASAADVVSTLLGWAAAEGVSWAAAAPGLRGLTALHLAAITPDAGALAAALTAACPDALAGWESAAAEDGSSPLALAVRAGTAADAERVLARAQFAAGASSKAPPPEPAAPEIAAEAELLAELAAASTLPRAKGPAGSFDFDYPPPPPLELAPLSEKGAALLADVSSDAALRFAQPALEAKYARWFAGAQAPVDAAFRVIATLSQAAWVLRWGLARSAPTAVVMAALMLFNVACLAAAARAPHAAAARRDALCVVTMLVHKAAQMAVTLAPVYGTIYSPTYSATTALVESSSFAQVAMLAMGVRPTFAALLPTLLVMAVASAATNAPVCGAAWPGAPLGACVAGLAAFQAVACTALPAAAVYLVERRARRVFLATAVE